MQFFADVFVGCAIVSVETESPALVSSSRRGQLAARQHDLLLLI